MLVDANRRLDRLPRTYSTALAANEGFSTAVAIVCLGPGHEDALSLSLSLHRFKAKLYEDASLLFLHSQNPQQDKNC